jgi:hypothetical protein
MKWMTAISMGISSLVAILARVSSVAWVDQEMRGKDRLSQDVVALLACDGGFEPRVDDREGRECGAGLRLLAIG